jgi:hypothetical protein
VRTTLLIHQFNSSSQNSEYDFSWRGSSYRLVSLIKGQLREEPTMRDDDRKPLSLYNTLPVSPSVTLVGMFQYTKIVKTFKRLIVIRTTSFRKEGFKWYVISRCVIPPVSEFVQS